MDNTYRDCEFLGVNIDIWSFLKLSRYIYLIFSFLTMPFYFFALLIAHLTGE